MKRNKTNVHKGVYLGIILVIIEVVIFVYVQMATKARASEENFKAGFFFGIRLNQTDDLVIEKVANSNIDYYDKDIEEFIQISSWIKGAVLTGEKILNDDIRKFNTMAKSILGEECQGLPEETENMDIKGAAAAISYWYFGKAAKACYEERLITKEEFEKYKNYSLSEANNLSKEGMTEFLQYANDLIEEWLDREEINVGGYQGAI